MATTHIEKEEIAHFEYHQRAKGFFTLCNKLTVKSMNKQPT